ncbi:4-hydroxythreonine-4-phosphate dehydrogenase PdxA [Roseospirillum parvum]|uniref:4-hydroxythreonine-4-phosphate dehydrogenase n=1 Tax=Roseospirillum parvum TaxID=83401 RepID=A0A1G8ERT4_9PROT|nr:4-hydroxythreonine-4-phosphate dehydrogenase PdxA [Roseospirillum parvum]SDH72576.1 4-hydroxythreonine-4-phosphate dehydrogenase [Roseospirillum parvum]
MLAVTMGDPAGVGGELILALWAARHADTPPFLMIDDAGRLEALARHLGLEVPVARLGTAAQAAEVFDQALPVLPLATPLAVPPRPGHPDPANAPAIIAAIRQAAEMALGGAVSAMVTNPISKAVLQDDGFAHPGHTEFLGHLADGAGADPVDPVMMLVAPNLDPPLRVVPVTIHLPLARVAGALSRERIVATGRVTARALKQRFGIARPRLAVAALNPHAGEQGRLGNEERALIAPAVADLKAEGITVHGPLPADTLFHEPARAEADAVLCMYHDQALIPLKTLDFFGGVNVTLGLPFIRCSPDHGTAFGLAGSGRADPRSLRAALRLAADLAAQRPPSRPTP